MEEHERLKRAFRNEFRSLVRRFRTLLAMRESDTRERGSHKKLFVKAIDTHARLREWLVDFAVSMERLIPVKNIAIYIQNSHSHCCGSSRVRAV